MDMEGCLTLQWMNPVFDRIGLKYSNNDKISQNDLRNDFIKQIIRVALKSIMISAAAFALLAPVCFMPGLFVVPIVPALIIGAISAVASGFFTGLIIARKDRPIYTQANLRELSLECSNKLKEGKGKLLQTLLHWRGVRVGAANVDFRLPVT